MKVLAFNHTTNSEMAFENIAEFNMACKWHKLELIDDNYEPASVIDEIEVEEIKVEKVTLKDTGIFKTVIHKDELSKYKVTKFREALNSFSGEDLETFIKYDERKSIVNLAKAELKKRK
jgi:hypothetical protein